MFKFGMLTHSTKGEVIRMANHHSNLLWRVVEVRNLTEKPLSKKALKNRPEIIRSAYYARLQSLTTGRIRTIYRAENIAVYG